MCLSLEAPGRAVQQGEGKAAFPHRPFPPHPRARMGLEGGERRGGAGWEELVSTNPINQVRDRPCKTHSRPHSRSRVGMGAGLGPPPIPQGRSWDATCPRWVSVTPSPAPRGAPGLGLAPFPIPTRLLEQPRAAGTPLCASPRGVAAGVFPDAAPVTPAKGGCGFLERELIGNASTALAQM